MFLVLIKQYLIMNHPVRLIKRQIKSCDLFGASVCLNRKGDEEY